MFRDAHAALSATDPDLAELLLTEERRQRDKIRMIASENYVSAAVLAATGSVLTNKYSEGYPGKRYYEGQQVIDQVEQLCIDRARDLFAAEHANVQPYSGSPANLAVYFAFLRPGDTVMGLGLPAGGHLTHGWSVSITGSYFRAVQYGVRRDTHRIDLDEVRALALAEKPKLLFAGGTAVPRTIDFAAYAEIAREVGAIFVADIAHISGLVAAGVHPSPVPHADVVSTTTHKTLRGPRGGLILMRAEHEKAINSAIFPGIQGGPLEHVIAAKAVALKEAMTQEFKNYQEQVIDNAQVMCKVLKSRGLRIVSGRTESHVFLVDLRAKNLTGKEAEAALGRAHLTVNKNTIPNDPQKALVTSGIRLGTPAMTTRGFTEIEAEQVANLIADVLDAPSDETVLARVRGEVSALCKKFPVYG